MSPSFSCVSPKIDDSPPQAEWACLKMHEVMRPSFILLSLPLPSSLPLSISPHKTPRLMAAATFARAVPTVPKRSEATSKSDSPLPFPALVKTTERDVWRSDSLINDAAEDPRLINRQKRKKKKAGSHWYDALNQQGGGGGSVVHPQCSARG